MRVVKNQLTIIEYIKTLHGIQWQEYMQISIDGHSINETDQVKFLGVIIDSTLNWKNDISYITGLSLDELVL